MTGRGWSGWGCGLVVVSGLGACAIDPEVPVEHGTDVQAVVGAASIDLISPATCVLINGKLRQCAVAPQTVALPALETAVPLRTVVRRIRSGNCSTQYPLAVHVRVDDAPEVKLSYLSESQVVLRRPGGAISSSFGIRDGSSWTPFLAIDGSCRVSLVVDSNEVDVDTVEQAQALLAAIDQELAAARTDVRNYEALLALQAAYTFTRAVASSFHAELTSDTMQALRQAAIDAAPAMEEAAMGCGDALSEPQRDTLFQLYVSLVALGDPQSWQHPDGSPRTLADFYGEGAAEVLAQLEQLAANASPDLETEFRVGLEAAAAEVVRLEQRRALAVQQLEPWLGGAP